MSHHNDNDQKQAMERQEAERRVAKWEEGNRVRVYVSTGHGV